MTKGERQKIIAAMRLIATEAGFHDGTGILLKLAGLDTHDHDLINGAKAVSVCDLPKETRPFFVKRKARP